MVSDARTVVATRYDLCVSAAPAAVGTDRADVEGGTVVRFAMGRMWEGGSMMAGRIALGHDRLGELCAGSKCHGAQPSRRELLQMLSHTLEDVASAHGVVDTRPQSVVIAATEIGANDSGGKMYSDWQSLAVGEQIVVDRENGTVWRRCITAACELAKHRSVESEECTGKEF